VDPFGQSVPHVEHRVVPTAPTRATPVHRKHRVDPGGQTVPHAPHWNPAGVAGSDSGPARWTFDPHWKQCVDPAGQRVPHPGHAAFPLQPASAVSGESPRDCSSSSGSGRGLGTDRIGGSAGSERGCAFVLAGHGFTFTRPTRFMLRRIDKNSPPRSKCRESSECPSPALGSAIRPRVHHGRRTTRLPGRCTIVSCNPRFARRRSLSGGGDTCSTRSMTITDCSMLSGTS
jgi:hypothetical protein